MERLGGLAGAGLGPDSGGMLRGLAGEGCSGPHPGGLGPYPRGSRPTPRGCIPACTEADPPAADGY